VGISSDDFKFEKYRHLFSDDISELIPKDEFVSYEDFDIIGPEIDPEIECIYLGFTDSASDHAEYLGFYLTLQYNDFDYEFPFELLNHYKEVLVEFFGEEIRPLVKMGVGFFYC